MYFHNMLGANDLEASKAFYDATFATLGVPAGKQFRESPKAYMFGAPGSGLFLLGTPMDGKPATHANGGTVMFQAKTKEEVAAWYAAGLAHGGAAEDAPAPGGLPNSTVARMRDPTGNKIGAIAFG